jgi:hypothetical protein
MFQSDIASVIGDVKVWSDIGGKSFSTCGFLICRLAMANIHFFQQIFLLDFVPSSKL